MEWTAYNQYKRIGSLIKLVIKGDVHAGVGGERVPWRKICSANQSSVSVVEAAGTGGGAVQCSVIASWLPKFKVLFPLSTPRLFIP